MLGDELTARRESGFDVSRFEDEARVAVDAGGDPDPWLDRLEGALRIAGWPFDEPSSLDEILDLLPPATQARDVDDQAIGSRIHGAWLGRCAGCMLGKPVEGWTRAEIREYVELSGSYPIRDFIPLVADAPRHLPALKASWPETTRGRVDGVARDDDIDYTILGLHILETHGREFTADDVATELLDHLPFTQVFTAERAAYRNLVNGLRPPSTAAHRNPYREWIGALIRADIFGLVSPGDARAAALLAFRDASVSHTGNGIYAAMWAAGLIAECLVAADVEHAIRASMAQVPSGTRLSAVLTLVVERFEAGASWTDLMDEIDETHGHYSWVHAIPNAAVVAAAMLWSAGDHVTGVGLAVAAGRDTDSTAATVGAALGALGGPDRVSSALTAPLHDRIRSAIAGFDAVAISDLAQRTHALGIRSA